MSEPCTSVFHRIRTLVMSSGPFRYAAALLAAMLLPGCDPGDADAPSAPYIPSPDGVVAEMLDELEPGNRVLSHDYPVEGWEYQRLVEMQRNDKIPVTGVARTLIYLYVVPANVAGRWQVSLPQPLGSTTLTLDLDQDVTRVSGRAILDDRRYPLDAVSLRGRQFSFQISGLDAEFSGEVSQDRIRGEARVGGASGIWRAGRADD